MHACFAKLRALHWYSLKTRLMKTRPFATNWLSIFCKFALFACTLCASACLEYPSFHCVASKHFWPPKDAQRFPPQVKCTGEQGQLAENRNSVFVQICPAHMHKTHCIILEKVYLCYGRIEDTLRTTNNQIDQLCVWEGEARCTGLSRMLQNSAFAFTTRQSEKEAQNLVLNLQNTTNFCILLKKNCF